MGSIERTQEVSRTVQDRGRSLACSSIIPKYLDTSASTRWLAPGLRDSPDLHSSPPVMLQ